MTPVSDLSSDQLMFRSPSAWRRMGGIAACLGVASVLAAIMAPGFPQRLSPIFESAGACIALGGILLYSWRQRLRLDLRGRRFDYFAGIGRFGRYAQGDMADFDRV